jgi:hypothetical protein
MNTMAIDLRDSIADSWQRGLVNLIPDDCDSYRLILCKRPIKIPSSRL